MASNENVIRFDDVSFEYSAVKPILDEVSFNVRKGSKITIMGQNGAGKSTIHNLITGHYTAEAGEIHLGRGLTIAISKQVIPRDKLDMTVRDFFLSCFDKVIYDIDPRIDAVLETVNLVIPHDRILRTFSGGQQARLLLASALIQDPDILLLDEPTNNLDHAGIDHLTDFLKEYKKTCLVISHDADFLNSFTDGVLYLDARTRKVEQYVGNYSDVVKQITARVEKENRQNALLEKEIQAKKDKANFFAMKGGNLRAVAKRMRDAAAEMEEEKVDVRKEDKTIRNFIIPVQDGINGDIITIESVQVHVKDAFKTKSANVKLRKNKHLLLKGPNGIGKSTLLEALVNGTNPGATVQDGIVVGYYRQDFSNLDFDQTVYEMFASLTDIKREEVFRAVAAGMLITSDIMNTKIGNLSEGQKGLVAFARLVLLKPGLLILDEPTNHINFRHLPIIAKALDQYEGAMILVSHVPEFVKQIRIDDTLELGNL